jgi:hypothetical protein
MHDGRDGGTVLRTSLHKRQSRGRPFQPGPDPRRNSGGRRATPISAALARLLTEDDALEIAAGVIARAKAGDQWSIQFLTDRLEGKAVARKEQGEAGDFSDLDDIDTETLRKALRRVQGRPVARPVLGAGGVN